MTNKFKFSSVFIKTFLMLSVSSTVLLIVFNVSFIGFYNKTFEQRLYASNLNMVTKTRNYLDVMLRDVIKEANLLSQDSNIINLAVVPSLTRSARNHGVISRLRSVVAENRYIKSVYIYIPTGNLVFSSTEGITPLASFGDKGAIVADASQGPRSGAIAIRADSAAGTTFDALTLYKDFPKDGVWRLGQVIVNLNSDVLNEAIRNQSDVGSDELVVIDGSNAVTLGKYAIGSKYQGGNLSRQAEEIEQGVRRLVGGGEGNVAFYADSAVVDWRCIYRIEENKGSIFAQMAFAVFLPTSLIFLLISFIFAWVLSNNLYRPVDQLLKLVLLGQDPDKAKTGKKSPNEYELIGARFSGVVERNERLEALIESSIPFVKIDLFSMLLHNAELDSRDIDFFRQYLSIDDYRLDNYIVFIAGLKTPSACRPAELVEQRFVLLRMKDEIGSLSAAFERIICSSSNPNQIATVCRFDHRFGDGEIRARLLDFIDRLKQESATGPAAGIAISVGKPYCGFESIARSYGEAQEAMKYSLYLDGDETVSPDRPGEDEEAARDEASQAWIKDIVAAVGVGDVDEVNDKVAAFFEPLRRADPRRPGRAKQAALRLIDSIAQFLITSHFRFNGMIGREKEVFATLGKLDDTNEIFRLAAVFCAEAAQSALSVKATRHSKYVVKAREYVEENYADCDLSLNSAATHVGINSSYLSTLFKNETHESFIDFINRLRIRKAKELLDNTFISVKEAGYAVGFNTIHNFIRTFKKFEGTTPGKYNELTRSVAAK
jgi:two-component system response regulator YesN